MTNEETLQNVQYTTKWAFQDFSQKYFFFFVQTNLYYTEIHSCNIAVSPYHHLLALSQWMKDTQNRQGIIMLLILNPCCRSSPCGLHAHTPVPAAPPQRGDPLPHWVPPALPVHHLDQGQADLWPLRDGRDSDSNKRVSAHHQGTVQVFWKNLFI